jgi:hypothetical protein
MYRFLLLVTMVGPTVSMAHVSKGFLAVKVICIGTLDRGPKVLFIWQLLRFLT